MENFVSGILIANNPHAVYEGSVFDRYLVLQFDNGQTLFIFDPHCESEKLVAGERYQVIVEPLITKYLHYIERESELSTEEGEIDGKIRDLNWAPPEMSSGVYRAIDKRYLLESNQPFMLIETPYGTVIFSTSSVEEETKMNGEEFKIGAFLQWTKSRFDFVAALDPLA
ncbi:MAG: hypothetical protein K8L91_06655 [Anaerolineae bacterium]|nr:hypothetical protein [Anaerolineae bacterium]